jgi:hypothetical protein
MRFDPASFLREVHSSPTTAPPPAKPVKTLNYRFVDNPYRHWLILLCVGAAVGCASYLVDATWSMAILGQRVRSFPTRHLLRMVYPFLTLATVALTWVSVWLLTSEPPTPQRHQRLSANVLRLLVTSSFLASSAYVLRLLESFGAMAWAGWFSWLLQSIDIIVILLLWPHLLLVAGRLGLRGMRWRTAIVFVGLLVSTVLAALPPDMLTGALGLGSDLNRHLQNLRLAHQVLWSTLAALVLLRFAVAFGMEARRD